MPVWLPIKSHEPQIGDKLLLELGRVVMYWAWFEDCLLADIRELIKLSQPPANSSADQREIPLAFSKRLKFWFDLSMELYSEIPRYKEEAQSIRDAASILAKDRNLLVHGFLAGWEPSSDGKVKLFHMRGNTLRIYQVDLGKLQSISSTVKEMNDSLDSLRINRLLGTHQVPDTRNGVAGKSYSS